MTARAASAALAALLFRGLPGDGRQSTCPNFGGLADPASVYLYLKADRHDTRSDAADNAPGVSGPCHSTGD